jgi:hypothetical protein
MTEGLAHPSVRLLQISRFIRAPAVGVVPGVDWHELPGGAPDEQQSCGCKHRSRAHAGVQGVGQVGVGDAAADGVRCADHQLTVRSASVQGVGAGPLS